jgi:hypothetical protein
MEEKAKTQVESHRSGYISHQITQCEALQLKSNDKSLPLCALIFEIVRRERGKKRERPKAKSTRCKETALTQVKTCVCQCITSSENVARVPPSNSGSQPGKKRCQPCCC